jgi:hypothetical protein
MTATTIGSVGERIVVHWLTVNNYSTNWDTKGPGATDIEARSNQANLLVQVKTAVAPNQSTTISSEERTRITSRAGRLGWQAWLAQVQVDRFGNQVGKTHWTQLS